MNFSVVGYFHTVEGDSPVSAVEGSAWELSPGGSFGIHIID
jgi:hypothetical protein